VLNTTNMELNNEFALKILDVRFGFMVVK